MLERLLALLRGKPVPVDARAQRPSVVPEEDFEQSLDQRLARPSADSTILAGSLQLIGLDDVKLRLGVLWDRVASEIHRISHEEIRARMSERDVFRMHNNHTFLICFGGSDEQLAARTRDRAAAMGGESVNRDFMYNLIW